ncbi:MAG: polysaccharide deacetylase family protein [Eubacterium sp.]|nr:polysaccharide deacetylase family protein [Eubacterium sp.]
MKTKKNRYGIVLSVTVLLFFMGVAKLFTISQAQLERPKALSGSSVSQEDADLGLQEKKKIALTFDDGPDSEYTPMLLDGLAERNVKATFFVIGKQAEAQPEVMERLVKEGHLIGNHTYNHVDIQHMTASAAKEEILKANEIIAKYTGEEPCFLRPPFGSGSSRLEKEIEMIPVLWTIDTMDWSCQNESRICSTVYREIKENSIILMHDEYPTTVRAALSIIDKLQKDGYEFVTVDKIVMD